MVAVPGKLTTANLLFNVWKPGIANTIYLPYDEIVPALVANKVSAGVIIHESRFTFAEHGLVCLADLGAWWEDQTNLPIPLGGIVARKNLGPSVANALCKLIRDSIDFSRKNPDTVSDYISDHAQEISPEVQNQHIDMFVNEFSLSLGSKGRDAVERLTSMAKGKVSDL